MTDITYDPKKKAADDAVAKASQRYQYIKQQTNDPKQHEIAKNAYDTAVRNQVATHLQVNTDNLFKKK